jgi:hypothetical protein
VFLRLQYRIGTQESRMIIEYAGMVPSPSWLRPDSLPECGRNEF